MSSQATTQNRPILPVLDTESLRRKLAGLADPNNHEVVDSEKVEIREAASRLCSILAKHFGDDLDRTTLWSRIDSGLQAACSKVDDGDLLRFVHLCLEHVQADPGRVAACPATLAMLDTFAARLESWRLEFVSHIKTHRYPVIVHGRQRWEKVKNQEAEL